MPLSDIATKLVPEGLAALKKTIRAYHGSPHDFDRFDLNKIGSGEGAQVYGHGLYFAEREGVARHYRDQLQKTVSPHMTYDGARITPSMLDKMSRSADPAEAWVSRIYRPTLLSRGKSSLDKFYDDAQRAADERDMWWQRKASHEANPPVASTYTPLDYEVRAHTAQRRFDDLNSVMSRLGLNKGGPTGKMYEVNINAEPSDFVNWDKALADQPKVDDLLALRFGAGAADAKANADFMQRPMSGFMYDLQHPKVLGSPQRVADAFRDVGIPGVRYLDATSRKAGEGTSNYVVNDPGIIDIMKKYAMPGVVGSGVVGGAMGNQQQGGW